MALRIAKDTRSPSLTDTLTVDGVAFALTTSTVKFKMRAVGSATLKVDSAAVVVSAPAGTVRYDWAAADVDTAGDYLGWWEVTLPGGKVQDHPEFAIEIQAHAMASGLLAEVAEVRDFLQKPSGDREQDTAIANALSAASSLICEWAGREFIALGTNPATRLFEIGGYARAREIPISDLSAVPTAVSTIDADGATVETLTVADDIVALPLVRKPWQPITSLRIRPSAASLSASYLLSVTGTWGFPTVPEDVKQACIVTVGIWIRRDVQAFASTFNLDENRVERPRALPSAARDMLTRYRHIAIG